MRAASMVSGACTNGSTVRRRVGTRRNSTRRGDCGGAVTTSIPSADPGHGRHNYSRGTGNLRTNDFRPNFPASLPGGLGGALCHQRGGNDRLVRLDVGDGGYADAGWLDDVNGVDADARTDMAWRRRIIPGYVDRDDGSHDAAMLGANAMALPPGGGWDRSDASRLANSTRWS